MKKKKLWFPIVHSKRFVLLKIWFDEDEKKLMRRIVSAPDACSADKAFEIVQVRVCVLSCSLIK